jgi:Putative cyclase
MAWPQIFVVLFSMYSLFHLPSLTASGAHPAYDDQPSCSVASSDSIPTPIRREEFDGGRIIDISHFYHLNMPAWESSEGIGQVLWLPRSMSNGSVAYFSEMKLGAHTGTHVDAPGHVFQHYFEAGFDVDTLDLAVLNGICFAGCLPLVLLQFFN